MKTLLVTLSMAVAGLTFSLAPQDADAKRLGGGQPAGMQRQQSNTPPAATPPTATPTPAQNPGATAAGATAGAAAAAGKRSWLGPLAGLAAGLGIAALLSHFGLGEAFANMMMFALLAVVAVVAIGWLMRRFGKKTEGAATPQGMQFAGAGAHAGAGSAPAWQAQQPTPVQATMPAAFTTTATPAGGMSSASATPITTGSLTALPADFDVAGFERIAKTVFIRMQAANDGGQVEDLRKFTTPELFASLRVDLQERGAVEQHTDVEELHAKIIDAAQENSQQIVSVRFDGRLSERSNGQTKVEAFAELWHFVRPIDGSREWAIAGITPVESTVH